MTSRDSHVRSHVPHFPPTKRRSPAPDAASLAGADQSPTVDAVAGAAGALLALLSTYPLMTLNTRQHTERRAGGADAKRATTGRDGDSYGTRTNAKPRRVSMFDELRAVAREDGGLKGLYRGIEPAVIGTVTSQTVYNYFYAVLRNASARRRRDAKGEAPSALESLAIASVAGAINVLLTIPIWTVCVRMQAERANEEDANALNLDAAPPARREKKNASNVVSSFFSSSRTKSADGSSSPGDDASPRADDRSVKMKKKKTFFETTAAVWHENGAAGFWRGVVPSLMMVANPALQYAFYERAGDSFLRRRRRENKNARAVKLTAWEVFLAASFAKMGATVLTYPVLLVKTRLQASEKKGTASYDGAFDALRRIAREEGVAAFYRGMGTKMTQTVFAAALMFVTKEEIAKAVGKVAARRARRGA
jgi:adenine nucleotide transporter 17